MNAYLTGVEQDMLRLTAEESAELLLVLNEADLTRYPPGVQRIRERLQALPPGPLTITVDQAPHPVSPTPPSPAPRPKPQAQAPHPPSQSESHVLVPSLGPQSPPEYTLTEKDLEFRSALNELRRDRTQALFGLAILNNLGPYLIMADPVLDRIAECARAQKLAGLDDLYRETAEWCWEALELGEQVLELVSR